MSSYGLDGTACESLQIAAGRGQFVSEHPHHAHLVRNEGTLLEFTVAYFNVPSGEKTRIDAERPAECPEHLN